MTSDATLMFMFKKLDTMHHEIVARELVASQKRRIKERRLLVASTLNYLHNPKTYFDSSNDILDVFLRPDCDQMRKHIVDLQKLGQTADSSLEMSIGNEIEHLGSEHDEPVDTLPLLRQLEIEIPKKLQAQDNTSRPTDGDIGH